MIKVLCTIFSAAVVLSGCAPQWDGFSDIDSKSHFGADSPTWNELSPKGKERLYAFGVTECQKKMPGASAKAIDDCAVEGIWKYNRVVGAERRREGYREQIRQQNRLIDAIKSPKTVYVY